MSDISSRKGARGAYSSATIALDESGDLGFSPCSSGKFVIAATIFPEPNNLDRLANSARKKLGKNERKGELKFNTALDSTRKLMLKGLAKTDCQIVWVSIDKDKIPLRLREDKNLLYQILCEAVIREAIKLRRPGYPHNIGQASS